MRFSLPIFCLLALAVSVTADTPTPAPDMILHIGLCKHFSGAQKVVISSTGAFTVRDAQTGTVVLHGGSGAEYIADLTSDGLRLTRGEDSHGALEETVPLIVSPTENAPLEIAREDPSDARLPQRMTWHRYRGTLTLEHDAANALCVINNVPLEQYLYGVLPAEIGSDAPTEALKAQAIAARTYALKNRGKFAAQGFDLDDTTRCEGYDGINGETPAVDAAVDATQGLVLTWNGVLIDAPYSTDSGGMTACDPSSPYLQAVRDAATPTGPDYAADQKYHTWTLNYTPAQIQAVLAADPRTRVAHLQSLILDGFDASGRITTATVTGTGGTIKTVTGPQLREILGYDVLRSTLVTLTLMPNGNYQFSGKGWGHGLGMSQEGAVAMALPPYNKTCRDILSHYYVGTALMPWQEAQLTTPALPPPASAIVQAAHHPPHGA